ncbi:hypothetical protein [Pedobacter sp.]|uniref:hypothetical protein n=1 Tax=Pedobacter sp. TaxID=1411316 RepID=UPI0031E1F3F7
MNALFRLGAATLLVLLVMDAANSQQPVSAKLLDSVSGVAGKIPQKVSREFKEQKGKLFSASPLSFLSDSLKSSAPVKMSDISLGTGMQRIGNSYRAVYSVEGKLMLFKIPIDLQLSNNQTINLMDNPLRGNLFKAGFNREAFLKSLVPELDQYQQLKESVFNGRPVSTTLREQMMLQIQKTSKEKQQQYANVYQYINQYGSVEELLKLDEATLRTKMKTMATQRGDSLKNRGMAAAKVKLEEGKQLDEGLLDSLSQQVWAMKQLLQTNGIAPERIGDIEKQVLSLKPDLNAYASKYGINDIRQKGWQGLLNRLGDVEMGSFGQQLPGSFMNKDLFLEGGSISLQTSKGPLQLGLASSQDIGFSKDAGFTHSNFNIPKLVTFVSVPVIGNGYAKSRISWTGSIEKQSYRLNESAGISPRSGSALTLSQELGSEKMGKFTLEVSKSAASFRNVGQIGSEHLLLERNTFGNYFKDDLFETMAFGVKYDLNDQKSRLNTNVFFNYSGIGFQNPAQQGFGNMGMRMGGAVKKGFLKNKVVLNLRGDFKNTPVSGTSGAHWQNHNLNMEARFRFSRKFNFAVKYMDNGVQKSGVGAEQQQSVYGSRKYQFDASSSYRLFKKSGFSHLVLGLQDMSNPIANSASQFLTSIYTQSLSLGEITLMGNVFYNKELRSQSILGDMVNADAAVQYKLLEKVTASTALTYLNNTGQAKQFGIKQNAQFSLWKHMEVNLYADVRKNMITPLYPDLFASNRAEVSLKYYFR